MKLEWFEHSTYGCILVPCSCWRVSRFEVPSGLESDALPMEGLVMEIGWTGSWCLLPLRHSSVLVTVAGKNPSTKPFPERRHKILVTVHTPRGTTPSPGQNYSFNNLAIGLSYFTKTRPLKLFFITVQTCWWLISWASDKYKRHAPERPTSCNNLEVDISTITIR